MKIVNKCKKLPPFALWYVNKGLKWISSLDLQGIEYIVLMDKALEPDVSASKAYKHAYVNGFAIFGEYAAKNENYPAIINLYIEGIYRPIPYLAYFSPMPILIITQSIAHEVGHHLVRTRGYIFTPDEKYPNYNKKPEIEEEMADRYAFSVVEKMKKKLCYRFGAYLMNYFSDSYYGIAMARWGAKRYQEAADNWYKSSLLNSERQESVEWYYHSIRKLKEKKNLQ